VDSLVIVVKLNQKSITYINKNRKVPRYLEIKQRVSKQSMHQTGSLKGNEKIYGIAKAVRTGNFIALSAYIRNEESSQINSYILILRNWKRKRKVNPKQAEGKK